MTRLLIAELWNSYATTVLPPDAPAIQRQETRRAFYAGCRALFKAINECLDPGLDETKDDLRMMSDMHRELEQFAYDVKRERA